MCAASVPNTTRWRIACTQRNENSVQAVAPTKSQVRAWCACELNSSEHDKLILACENRMNECVQDVTNDSLVYFGETIFALRNFDVSEPEECA